MSKTLRPDNYRDGSLPSPANCQMEDKKPYDEVTPIGRAIYYVLGVSSLIGLAYSKSEDGSFIEIPTAKYLAVILTFFFAVGLVPTLFFDRPLQSYKIGPLPQFFFAFYIYAIVFVIAFIYYSEAGLVFAMYVVTYGISIIQLSNPIEEFYVAKSLIVLSASLPFGVSFTANENMAFAVFVALYGVWGVMMIRDLKTAEFSSCHRVTSKQ